METITNIRDQLSEFVNMPGRKRLIRLIMLAVLVIAVTASFGIALNRGNYVDRGDYFVHYGGISAANRQAYIDYQKEEDIRRFLTSQDKIADAQVILNTQSEKNGALLNQEPSTASVTIWLADPGTSLADEEIAAIRNIIVNSVSENLLPENISIADHTD